MGQLAFFGQLRGIGLERSEHLASAEQTLKRKPVTAPRACPQPAAADIQRNAREPRTEACWLLQTLQSEERLQDRLLNASSARPSSRNVSPALRERHVPVAQNQFGKRVAIAAPSPVDECFVRNCLHAHSREARSRGYPRSRSLKPGAVFRLRR
jgi:hypothetical protein